MADRQLKIDITVDDHGAAKTAKAVEASLKSAGAAATGQAQSFDRLSSSVGSTNSILKTAIGTMTGFISAATLMRAASAGFGLIKEAAFGMNSTLETSTLQFTTLMGNADKARAHVRDLFDIAKKTPFETGPIIEASRMLQTFGGEALNTRANIIKIGDAAAATGAPINELGFWVGRLYSSLQAGKPFGESAMRLSELAVLSPQVRNKMEDLQKSGASASEIFRVFTTDMDRFKGAMEAQAGTWSGLVSTMQDSVNIMIAGALKPLFDEAKRVLGAFNEWLESPAAKEWGEAVTRAVTQDIIPALKTVGRVLVEDIWPFLKALGGVLLDGLRGFKRLWDDIPGPVKAAAVALWAVHAAVKAINLSASTGILARIMAMSPMGMMAAAGGAATLYASTKAGEYPSWLAGQTGPLRPDPIGGAKLLTPADLAGVSPLPMGPLAIAGMGGGAAAASSAASGGGLSRAAKLLQGTGWYWQTGQVGLPSLAGGIGDYATLPSRGIGGGLYGLVPATSGATMPGQGWFGSGLGAFAGQAPQAILGALMGGGNLTQTIGSTFGASMTRSLMGGKTGESIMKALTGSFLGDKIGGAIGSMIPGIGALLGPALSWVGGLFGPSKEYQRVKQDRAGFEAQFGGVDGLIKAVSEAYATLGRTGKEAETALKSLWDAKTPAAYEAAVKNITKAIEDAKTRTEKLAKLDGLKAQLELLEQQGVPTWQRMEEVAKQYGLALDSLGKNYQQLKINDTARDILNAYDTLKEGGVDTNTILAGMSDEISAVVQNSLKFGTTIPENMRPLIQQLMTSNQLLDENGVKIDDINKLSFGEAVKTDAELLAGAIRDLKDAIAKLTEELNGVPKSLPDPFAGWSDPGNRGGAGGGGGGDDNPQVHMGGYLAPWGIARYHRGGVVGGERLAVLQTGEGVLSRRGMATLGRLNAGGSVGGVSITIDARGSILENDSAIERLARKIEGKMTERLGRSVRFSAGA